MSTELNIHQLVRNQVLRHKLSYIIPMHSIDSLRKKRPPIYRTIHRFAVAYKEICHDDERDIEEIEKWLGEPAQTQ